MPSYFVQPSQKTKSTVMVYGQIRICEKQISLVSTGLNIFILYVQYKLTVTSTFIVAYVL